MPMATTGGPGAMPRAVMALAWLSCLVRPAHTYRCQDWCRWDWEGNCQKNQACADCGRCPPGSQDGCLGWCDGHCDDPKCAQCTECNDRKECTPVDRADVEYEECFVWCSTTYATEHCQKCSCRGCDFCVNMRPRDDDEDEGLIEEEQEDAGPMEMTDELW